MVRKASVVVAVLVALGAVGAVFWIVRTHNLADASAWAAIIAVPLAAVGIVIGVLAAGQAIQRKIVLKNTYGDNTYVEVTGHDPG